MTKIVHSAKHVNENGDVSALCYNRPRKINLAKANWTLRADLVTCPKCKARFKRGRAKRAAP